MARFLSPEWFEDLQRHADPAGPAGDDPAAPPGTTVVEQVVRATPDGDVVYRIEVSAGRARLVWPVAGDAPPPDLRITTDWSTAVAVARGDVSTQGALMQGRLRFSGRPERLGLSAEALAGLDPVPARVRSETTYGEA
ncbi:MAG: SCP2 sterol-binding domain-containing protein [Acidobacteriota bacterium]|nr:SCP2 sterol-binding domain-containing protein [Acidobacteriota bacterium]